MICETLEIIWKNIWTISYPCNGLWTCFGCFVLWTGFLIDFVNFFFSARPVFSSSSAAVFRNPICTPFTCSLWSSLFTVLTNALAFRIAIALTFCLFQAELVSYIFSSTSVSFLSIINCKREKITLWCVALQLNKYTFIFVTYWNSNIAKTYDIHNNKLCFLSSIAFHPPIYSASFPSILWDTLLHRK